MDKAAIIATETSVLDDEHLAAAEEMILAARAVITADPDGARRRREQTEREDAGLAGACDEGVAEDIVEDERDAFGRGH